MRGLQLLVVLLALRLAAEYAAAQPPALTARERALLPQLRPGNYVTTTWLDVLDSSAATLDSTLQKRLYQSIWPQRKGAFRLQSGTRVEVLQVSEFSYQGSKSYDVKGTAGEYIGHTSSAMVCSAAFVKVLSGQNAGKQGWMIYGAIHRETRDRKASVSTGPRLR
ncbi:MAG: hypothetical protein AB1758_13610 [Candidatus Eremiobacterota bacterium]